MKPPPSGGGVFTLLGAPGSEEGSESDIGILIREGTAGLFYNGIVAGFKEIGLEFDHRATFTQIAAGELVVDNMIFFGNSLNFSEDGSESPTPPFTTLFYATQMAQSIRDDLDPRLNAPFALDAPDFRPATDSPAVDGTVPVAVPPDDGFFDQVSYIGAMNATEDWTAGWTTSAQN